MKCHNCGLYVSRHNLKDSINCLKLNSEKLLELKKIYPDIVSLVDGWQQLAKIHGVTQTEREAESLKKYVKILKDLGVINEE